MELNEVVGTKLTLQPTRVISGNAGFAEDFTRWIFQETGVVKVISTTHHRKGEDSPKEIYRIKDDLVSTLSTLPKTY